MRNGQCTYIPTAKLYGYISPFQCEYLWLLYFVIHSWHSTSVTVQLYVDKVDRSFGGPIVPWTGCLGLIVPTMVKAWAWLKQPTFYVFIMA